MKNMLPILIFLMLIGCKKESDSPSTEEPPPAINVPPASQPVQTRIYAYLTDDQGRSVNFASHSLRYSNTAFTFKSDHLLTELIDADKYVTKTWVSMNSWDHFNVDKTVTLTPSVVNYVHYKATTPNAVATIDNINGSSVTLTGNLQVAFPAQSLYQVTTGPVPTTVKLSAHIYDPLQKGNFAKLPAYYAGDKDGKRYFLKSYGVAFFKATTLGPFSYYEVNVSPMKPATLKIPIPTSLLAAAPDSMPSWTIGQNGLWQQGAMAKKNGTYYEVSMFSMGYLMLAEPQNGTYINIHLKSALGSPVVNSTVRIKLGQQEVFEGQTDADGHILVYVPAGQSLGLEVPANPAYATGNAWTKTIGPFQTSADLPLVMDASVNGLVSIKGSAVTCAGQPIANGLVIVTMHDGVSYFPVKNGQYSSSLLAYQGKSIARLRVLNLADNVEGVDTAISVSNDQEYTANINTCPQSTDLYANYSIDGNSHSFKSPVYSTPTLSLEGFFRAPETTIVCFSNGKGFQFSTNAGSMGIFTGSGISGLFIDNAHYFYNVNKPMNVTFTRYDLISGGFIEGSFDFYYYDNNGVSRHLVGSFKVKRT